MNDEESARLNSPGKWQSIFELTINLSNLASICEWESSEDLANSPTSWVLKCIPYLTVTRIRRNRWYLNNANCYEYKIQWELEFSSGKNMSYQKLNVIVERAAERRIPAGSGMTNKYRSPMWWNNECQELLQRRKLSMRICTVLNRKEIMVNVQRKLKRKKISLFRGFCATLNRNWYISRIWRTIKRLNDNADERIDSLTGPGWQRKSYRWGHQPLYYTHRELNVNGRETNIWQWKTIRALQDLRGNIVMSLEIFYWTNTFLPGIRTTMVVDQSTPIVVWQGSLWVRYYLKLIFHTYIGKFGGRVVRRSLQRN